MYHDKTSKEKNQANEKGEEIEVVDKIKPGNEEIGKYIKMHRLYHKNKLINSKVKYI